MPLTSLAASRHWASGTGRLFWLPRRKAFSTVSRVSHASLETSWSYCPRTCGIISGTACSSAEW